MPTLDKSKELEVSLRLVNDKVNFIASTDYCNPISIDYIPPIGDNLGYTSLELLLMSLASCYGTALLLLLRRMQKTVPAMEIKAHGNRRTEHPTCFTDIEVEFIFPDCDITKAEVEKVLAMAENGLCPVHAMLKGNVEIRTVITIGKEK